MKIPSKVMLNKRLEAGCEVRLTSKMHKAMCDSEEYPLMAGHLSRCKQIHESHLYRLSNYIFNRMNIKSRWSR